MTTQTRAAVIEMMRRTGHVDKIAEAEATLPEFVDTERDATLLNGLGLERGDLMQDMGSSP